MSRPIVLLWLFVVTAAVSACGQQTTIVETAVSLQAASPTPYIRPTLPPTWTPTFTATPAPPTATRTPTPTPIPSVTPSAAEICQNFWVVTNLTGSAEPLYFNRHSQISMLLNTDSAEDSIHFSLTHRLTGEGKTLDLPGGQMVGGGIPVKDLPAAGLYDWSLSVQSAAYGELCKQTGVFIVISPESTRPEENTIR